jgi:hypothetical protein
LQEGHVESNPTDASLASRQAQRPSAFRGLLPNVLLWDAAFVVAIFAAEVACRVGSIA